MNIIHRRPQAAWLTRWSMAALAVLPLTVLGQEQIPAKGDHAQLESFLKPVPALEPAEALKSFEVIDGFRLELVASEPLVNDPVAGAFDEDGRLYIAELRDYPYRPKPGDPPLGRIRLLEDTDGDGRFDRSHVFADQLMWPTGVAVWRGGVFVAATPDIWYFKDSDGDHRADVRRRVYSGFGTEKAQGSLNNLAWGIDHKIYGAGSINGGEVVSSDDSEADPIPLDRKDFRFDPLSGQFDAISGRAQFGNSFDDWYNRFLCSQAHPAHHVVLPHRYLLRNPYLAVTSAVNNLSRGVTPIYRLSPLESWRVIRSSRRIAIGERTASSAGASHHVIDGAAGSTVYRGAAYPPSFSGNLFVGGAQTNLIHRMRLKPEGVTFAASRADEGTEFVRSSDIWFRPVNFINAPDGTLYVLDLYREILEAVHIPLDVVAHLDLTSGRDRGRIYRIAADGVRPTPAPHLSTSSTEELVAHLENPNSWWRETAQRLLYQRQAMDCVTPLRRLLRSSDLPQARLHAMWLLQGLQSLKDGDLIVILADRDPRNREHAVRLAETCLATSRDLLARVQQLAEDPNPRVRFQVAFSLGTVGNEDRDAAVAKLADIAARDSGDPWIRTAVLSSASATSHQLLDELLADRQSSDTVSSALIRQLAEIVGARNESKEIAAVLESAANSSASVTAIQRQIRLGLGDGLARKGIHITEESPEYSDVARRMLQQLTNDAIKTATDGRASMSSRRQAVELLGYGSFRSAKPTLVQLLERQESSDLQIAVVRSLAGFDKAEVASILLNHFNALTPAVRQAILSAVQQRTPWITSLLDAIQNELIARRDVDSTRRDRLVSHPDPEIRERARKLLGAVSARDEVLKQYQASLSMNGHASKGQSVFQRECMTCHRLGQQGHSVGPNLALTKNKTPSELLTQILDPNREVEPTYVQYSVVDRYGRIYSGMIASETASSIRVQRAEGAEDTVLRDDIEQIVSSGKSLMPEGLEQKISHQQMADLIAYLGATQYDIGTEAGLVEQPGKTARVVAGSKARASSSPSEINMDDEAYIFTPAGFDKPGRPAVATGERVGTLNVTIRDGATHQPTYCRVNVVGPNGNFYYPEENHLSTYNLAENWPRGGLRGTPRNRPTAGWGNRLGKAPVRYFGHFFYTSGQFTVKVPAGTVRIEAWKGFEYRPESSTLLVSANETHETEMTLKRTVSMAAEGYYSGDTHLHLFRSSDADDQIALDLLEAEDVRYGGILCYNHNTSDYPGAMDQLEYPARLGLGPRSIRQRGAYQIMSGQEYRSAQYGHMNLFLTDRIVLENTTLDPNTWPVYGVIGDRVRSVGGNALHAHGGYGKEIYADYVTGAVQGVELLQFGVYRGIELDGWYRILNAGFRFSAHGASDYPPCRKMSDCRTYTYHETTPSFPQWIVGVAAGRSFFTTGPLVLLEVDGKRPGDTIRTTATEMDRVVARVRVRSEVTAVTKVELIVNGEQIARLDVPASAGQGSWLELERSIPIKQSSWIAARASSTSPSGSPDGEAHTNPVYVYVDDKAPFDKQSLDWLIARLDEQIALHQKREFEQKERAIAYFLSARKRLLEIRAAGGQSSAL